MSDPSSAWADEEMARMKREALFRCVEMLCLAIRLRAKGHIIRAATAAVSADLYADLAFDWYSPVFSESYRAGLKAIIDEMDKVDE